MKTGYQKSKKHIEKINLNEDINFKKFKNASKSHICNKLGVKSIFLVHLQNITNFSELLNIIPFLN